MEKISREVPRKASLSIRLIYDRDLKIREATAGLSPDRTLICVETMWMTINAFRADLDKEE